MGAKGQERVSRLSRKAASFGGRLGATAALILSGCSPRATRVPTPLPSATDFSEITPTPEAMGRFISSDVLSDSELGNYLLRNPELVVNYQLFQDNIRSRFDDPEATFDLFAIRITDEAGNPHIFPY